MSVSRSSLQTSIMQDQPYVSGYAGSERAALLEGSVDVRPAPEASDGSEGVGLLPGPPKPADRYKSVYMIMFLQGMGMLFGWNMFITAVVYFQSRLEGSRWHDCVENYVTFAFQVCNVGVQLLLTAYPTDVVFPMLCVNTLVFGACLALVYVQISLDLFFGLTMGRDEGIGRLSPSPAHRGPLAARLTTAASGAAEFVVRLVINFVINVTLGLLGSVLAFVWCDRRRPPSPPFA